MCVSSRQYVPHEANAYPPVFKRRLNREFDDKGNAQVWYNKLDKTKVANLYSTVHWFLRSCPSKLVAILNSEID